jgi:hypothetical protein
MKYSKADVFRELGLVNLKIQTILKNRTKITSAYEGNGSRIKRFRKREQSGSDEALHLWLKKQRSDYVAVSSSLLMITVVLPKF